MTKSEGRDVFWNTKEKLFVENLEFPNLPEWINKQEFGNDMLGIFDHVTPRGGNFNLRKIKKTSRYDKNTFSIHEWAELQRFNALIKNTPLYKKLTEKYDKFGAARYLLSFITARTEIDSRNGHVKVHLMDVVRKILNDAYDEDSLMMKMIGTVYGDGASRGQNFGLQFLKEAMLIEEALKHVMLKYQPMSKVSTRRIPSLEPADDTEPDQIKEWNDVPQVVPSELAQDDDEFWLKAARQELHKIYHFKREKLPKKYVMCLDVSGSMQGIESVYACASAIALLTNTTLSKTNKAIILPFSGYPFDPIESSSLQNRSHPVRYSSADPG